MQCCIFAANLAKSAIGLAQNTGIVAAAQAAVRAKHQQYAVLDLLVLFQERVLEVDRVGAEVGRQLRDLARVPLRLQGALEGPLESGGGNQLHGPRDLADILDRLAALDESTSLGHGYLSFDLGPFCCDRESNHRCNERWLSLEGCPTRRLCTL